MTQVFVALGSNLNQPLMQINAALVALKSVPQTRYIQCSPFYRTKPLGSQQQSEYLNAVVELDTTLLPENLLGYTQQIEQNQDRIRTHNRWAARTLDIDILLFGQQTLNTPKLTIPHYDMKNREFMLYPLFDLAPDLIFPDGSVLKNLIAHMPKNGMRYWQ